MRRRLTLSTLSIGLVLLTLAGSATGRAAKTVEVADDFFEPSTLTVKQGTTLDFEWVGEGEHNVFKESGPGPYFDSGNFQGSGNVYSRKFKKPGRYVLGCILHEDMDLNLRVKKKRR